MNSNFYIIMNKHLGGGSIQYIEDTIPFYKIMTKRRELKEIPKNSILILQPFIGLEITVDDILEYYKIKTYKIIIPIHDWYWIL